MASLLFSGSPSPDWRRQKTVMTMSAIGNRGMWARRTITGTTPSKMSASSSSYCSPSSMSSTLPRGSSARPSISSPAKAFGGIAYMIRCWDSGMSPVRVARKARLQRSRTVAFSPEEPTMNKEDHDRERQRWLIKMDDIETRLAEAETLNADMNQIKAELNKKIVELERNQRPLIEQNRKLNERNKNLLQEIKRLEIKISHSQDDFLSLKDSHERLQKENSLLKRERTFPEKLEELERYRSQVLEYSKCITALRQSGLEKDRRYELLANKFKRLRKFVKKSEEEDRHSTVGSEGSAESSISLDTIAEDLEESVNNEIESNYQELYRENEQLQKALHDLRMNSTSVNDEIMLRDQLAFARATIAQQQLLIDNNNERADLTDIYKKAIADKDRRLREMEEQVECLTRDLACSQERYEDLEFQILEMKENIRHQEQMSSMQRDVPTVSNDRCSIHNMSLPELKQIKEDMYGLRIARNLEDEQRDLVNRTARYLESLHSHLGEAQSEDEGFSEDMKELRRRTDEAVSAKNELSNELARIQTVLQVKDSEIELERVRAGELQQQLDGMLEAHRKSVSEMEQKLIEHEETIKTMREQLSSAQDNLKRAEMTNRQMKSDLESLNEEYIRLRNEARPSIKTELERRFEETRYRLNEALEMIEKYELVIDAARRSDGGSSSFSDELQKELEECKQFNEHLERQFRAQTDIIDVLKGKVVAHKVAADFLCSLPNSRPPTKLQEALLDFANANKDKEAQKIVYAVVDIVEHLTREARVYETIPNDRKLRERMSADSSVDCISHGSEMTSSSGQEDNDDDWQRTKYIDHASPDYILMERVSSVH